MSALVYPVEYLYASMSDVSTLRSKLQAKYRSPSTCWEHCDYAENDALHGCVEVGVSMAIGIQLSPVNALFARSYIRITSA